MSQNHKSITQLDIISPQDIVSIASEKGQSFAKKDKIKTNQIRNFYSAINRIRQKVKEKNKFKSLDDGNNKFKELESQIDTELILLEPKLAYAAGRQSAVRNFYEFIKDAISAYKDSEDKEKAINNFIILIESVVAYHKFYGGE